MLRSNECPLVALRENFLDQSSVHGVTRTFGDDMADEWEAEKSNITDQIKHLMSDKFVREPKAD